jgi:hypothetical protein
MVPVFYVKFLFYGKILENWKTLGRVGTNSYFKIPIIFVKALTNTDIVVFCQKSIIFGTDGTK